MEDKINKSEILKNLKADMKEAERLQREWFIKREEWSSQTEGAPYGNEVDGKSKIVSKDIKKQRKCDDKMFDARFDEEEIKYYEAIVRNNPSKDIFLNGWKNRALAV